MLTPIPKQLGVWLIATTISCVAAVILTMSDNGIGVALATIELTDPDGETVILGSLWETQPVALVFLRHYG